MRYLKQFLLYLIIFIAVFTVSGEAYIYYLDSAANDCDHYFECKIESANLRSEYAEELKKLGSKLNLGIYAIDYRPFSADASRYTIYTTDDKTSALVKEKFKVNEKMKFFSMFSGHREIVFKDMSDIADNPWIYIYSVIGEKGSIEKLRSLTIDKYGTGKLHDGGYSGDHILFLTTAWSFALVVVIFVTAVESAALRQEICVKYINGYDKLKLNINVILRNILILSVASVMGMVIASLITEASAFGTYLVCAVLALLIVSTAVTLWQLQIPDIRKVFADMPHSKLQRYSSIILLSAALVLFISAMALCMQNIADAYKTINQRTLWNQYGDYESVVFFSREESTMANHELDNQYAADFYQRYLDEYDISLAFNIADNGGMSEILTDCSDIIVYANLKGAEKIGLPVDLSHMSKDSFYIISPYDGEKLKTKEVWSDLQQIIKTLSGDDMGQKIRITSVKKPYKTTLLDIKADNLPDNCVRNPIVIIDTHNTLKKEFAANVCTAIMKFKDENNFREFIESINYENQVWYADNVYDLYEQKRNSSMMEASVNIVLALVISILFYISFYAALKAEFKFRAQEISVRKILGEHFAKRYSLVFKMISIVLIITTGMLVFLSIMCNMVNLLWVFLSLTLSYLSIFIMFTVFITIYENHNIPKTLKGGY